MPFDLVVDHRWLDFCVLSHLIRMAVEHRALLDCIHHPWYLNFDPCTLLSCLLQLLVILLQLSGLVWPKVLSAVCIAKTPLKSFFFFFWATILELDLDRAVDATLSTPFEFRYYDHISCTWNAARIIMSLPVTFEGFFLVLLAQVEGIDPLKGFLGAVCVSWNLYWCVAMVLAALVPDHATRSSNCWPVASVFGLSTPRVYRGWSVP